MKVLVDGFIDRIPEYNKTSQEHLWVTLGVWKVDPSKFSDKDPVHLDTENLISVGAVGCYHCELPYKPHLLYRRCKGEPYLS